ncbi:MAG TPA: PEGA domain-containing protein [Anaeromyxobacteraceae bacterium]|nr:PEGA domain-containing protein [Anaeromyxobacteraceae bacterium]
MRVLALAALLLAAGPSLAADARPKIAVLDLQANGASKELTSAATSATANEIDRIGAFRVVTSEAIRDMLAFEKQRQMMGCTDGGCIAEIGGALGVDYIVSGKVTRIAAAAGLPETYNLDLTLSNVKKGQREGSVVEAGKSEGEILGKVGRAVQKLVAKILAGRSGTLVISAAEAGAVVKIDDQVRGTTPLQGQISLPSGPHLVVVEKQGFVAWQKDVQIQPAKVVEETATLVPSPDFIQAYESKQRKLRVGAWAATGVAVAGIGLAVWGQIDANRLYGNETTPGTFLYARRKLLDGDESFRAEATSLKSDVEQRQLLSAIGAGVGGAGAIAAAWFWIAGDDPNRYGRYRGGTARIDVVPTPGGAFASLTLGF